MGVDVETPPGTSLLQGNIVPNSDRAFSSSRDPPGTKSVQWLEDSVQSHRLHEPEGNFLIKTLRDCSTPRGQALDNQKT